jgi:hypothetical protein
MRISCITSLSLVSIHFWISAVSAFQVYPGAVKTTSTSLNISNLFNNEPSTPQLPKDVKDAVSKCRAAVQKGLENKMSRMEIEFPVGTKFGVEKANSKSKKRGGKLASAMAEDDGPNSGVTKDVLDTSDRELARLFVEMFQPLGGDHISVVFSDGALADVAASNWKGDLGAECRVMSMNKGRRKKSAIKGMGMGGGKKKKKQGFAAKMNAEFSDENSGPFKLPDNCEVALFVAPNVKDLIKIQQICDDVGMGTLIILLNARLDLVDNFGSEETQEFYRGEDSEFENLFYLSIAPQDAAPGCLMHRAYPSEWIVARKPKVGAPKTIATFSGRPTDDECRDAYDSLEIGDMEKSVEGVLENVATWLK